MPKLGLGLSLSRFNSSFFDPDASAYFTAAGITDGTAKLQINTFVVGVKALSLFNNMVCWPLRSAQNKGSGLVAYSLGGLGTYNGTLTNMVPTWGTDGITFDGTNDYISTALTSGFSAVSVFGISKRSGSGVMSEIYKDDEGVNREWAIFAELSGAIQSRLFNLTNSQITGPAVTTDFRVSCLRGSATVNKLRINNGSDLTSTIGTLFQGFAPVTLGAKSGGGDRFFNGVMAGAIIFNTSLSDSDTSSIYTLYKTTIGTGLGLP